MSNRAFLIVVLVAAALVALAVVMHTPAGIGVTRSMRSLHGE